MSVIASILIDVAAKVGAPMVKSILEKHVGGVAGSVGGAVIDAIAGQAGVSPQDLPKVPEQQLEAAIGAVEASPEIILAYTRGQELSNELMLAEMNSESRFGWMWRPAGMWLMLFLTAWFAFLRPVVNAALWSAGTSIQIEIGLDLATFLGIFTVYTGLYMGGHTVMKAVAKAKGA